MITRIQLLLILFSVNYLQGQTAGLISLNPAKTVKVVSVDLKDKFLDLEIYTKVKNISSDSISLKWKRRQPGLPEGWISQVCDGITCFEDFVSTNIDSASRINIPVTLKAGEEREFILHVFPVTKAGKGKIYIDLFSLKKPDSLLTTMEFDELAHIDIINALGQRMGRMEAKDDNKYDVSFLPPNIYFLKVQPKNGQALTKIMVKAEN